MKIISFFKKNIRSIIVFLTIVFIGLLVNMVRSITDDAIIESTFSEMEQIGGHYQDLLENSIEEAEDDLLLIAQLMADNDVNSENVAEFFESQSQVSEFETLYYIGLDGEGVSTDNEQYDFSENKSFINASNGETYIANPHVSEQTSSVVFDLSVPVIQNDEITGVLFCEINIYDFFEAVNEDKKYESDIFFVNSNLDLVYSTSENHVGRETIPDEDLQEMGMDNVSKAQNDIRNKQDGRFYYDYFGTAKVMVYYPIDMTDVALAMNVHIDSISSEIITASNYFDMVGSIIYWTVIALVLYVTFIQRRSDKRILKVAYFDPLTELPNMAKLKLEMGNVLQNNKKKQYIIIVIDIQNFKAINEIFGYEVGDRVLKLVKSFSDSFKEPSLITARIGSDKFAMFAGNGLLEDLSFFEQAVSDHYDEFIPELADYAGTFKIGRYKIEMGETNFDDIMSKANLAHLRAKASKGEMLCDYDETLKRQVIVEADINNKMKTALANEEFKVFLQPKFSASDDKLVGAEALVRWIEVDGKMIFPNDFIPLFERNGFIVELDKYILENVCKTINYWINKGLGKITVSVNCSRLNLENPFFVDGIVAIADKHNVPHECIEIELTESTTITNENTIEQLFSDLHKNGFKTSIDDFGAGYSSLGMLKNLHVDTLKMDRSFFVGSKNARRDDMLIDSIVKMSHNLGMYVVAEGIETKEQVELLKSVNCDAIQGYVYAKPMPVDEFENNYANRFSQCVLAHENEAQNIKNINDARYTTSFAPCGLLIIKVDERFTIEEANDYFFEMIGYTREEVREIFGNYGMNIVSAQNKAKISNLFAEHMQNDAASVISIDNKFVVKSGKEHLYRLNGKVAINENGKVRLYVSMIEITNYLNDERNL